MKLKTTLLGKTYVFRDLKQVLAKANEEKTGDKLAGLAAETAQERIAAKVVLSAVTLGQLRENPAVPYEQDEVTRIIQDDVNEAEYEKIRNWTVSDLREWLLAESTTDGDIRRLRRGLLPKHIYAHRGDRQYRRRAERSQNYPDGSAFFIHVFAFPTCLCGLRRRIEPRGALLS